jgi:hypothetical protein
MAMRQDIEFDAGGHFDAYVKDFETASGAARDWFLEHLGRSG